MEFLYQPKLLCVKQEKVAAARGIGEFFLDNIIVLQTYEKAQPKHIYKNQESTEDASWI